MALRVMFFSRANATIALGSRASNASMQKCRLSHERNGVLAGNSG